MANEKQTHLSNDDFGDGKDHSVAMDMAFSDAGNEKYMKLSLCIALYLVLGLIWLPGFSFGDKVFTVSKDENQPQKRRY